MNNKQKLPNDVQAADHNLSTLNDHLFDELDRLGDESLTGEEIAKFNELGEMNNYPGRHNSKYRLLRGHGRDS